MSADNGRRVTARELYQQMELLRQEQQAAHVRTRLWAVAASLAGSALGKTVLALAGIWRW